MLDKTYNKIKNMRLVLAGSSAKVCAEFRGDADITSGVWFFEPFIIKAMLEKELDAKSIH